MKSFIVLVLMIAVAAVWVYASDSPSRTIQAPSFARPKFLFKILSLENWRASSENTTIHLSSFDNAFIHLATEEQLPKILEKFWGDKPEYVLLKLDVSQLPGKLVLEANPGGSTKYYHLYDGSIPSSAVVEVTVRRMQFGQPQ